MVRGASTLRAMAQWKCRVCGFERYHAVAVLRKDGSRYETSFLACSGCSVMFLNATTFNGWREHAAEIDVGAVVTPLRKRRQWIKRDSLMLVR